MPEWKGDTPEDNRAYAMRLDPGTGEWSRCWYRDLRPGDIFRAFDANHCQMDPVEGCEVVDDPDFVSVVTAGPFHSSEDLWEPGCEPECCGDLNRGWAVEVRNGKLKDVMRQVAC